MAKQTTSTPQAPTSGGRTASVPVRRPAAPNILTFFQESRAELRKVTWPTRQEAMNLTSAVIVMTVALSVFLGIIDTALDWIVKPLIGAK